MAFENVFGNIDFQAPTRARQQEAAQFQQLLGNAISGMQEQKRYDEQMELKRLEIENKPVDVFNQAENAILKKNMGMELTPQDQALIQTASQLGKDQIYTDAAGRIVRIPSPYSKFGGRTQGIVPEVGASRIPSGSPAIGGATMAQYGEFPAHDMIADDYVAPMDNVPLPVQGGQVPFNEPQDVVSPPEMQAPEIQATGALAQTPMGQKAALEANLKLKQSIAEKQQTDALKRTGDVRKS